jgi:phosphonatase-like hydrolase
VRIELAALDLAGTTVRDDGLVVEAFTRAMEAVGACRAGDEFAGRLEHVQRTMGRSKIEVFHELFPREPKAARAANAAFEDAYADLVDQGLAEPIPGARQVVEALRAGGVKVCFTTGFAPPTRDALLASLGWAGLADAVFSPHDAGRGRPHPDMLLAALSRLRVGSAASLAAVGDTKSDIAAGLAAGAGLVCGVKTGAHSASQLAAAGAHRVLESVADLPQAIGLGSAAGSVLTDAGAR